MRLATATALANAGRREALRTFSQLLDSDDVAIRLASVRSLRYLTNQKFGFNALSTTESNRVAKQAWLSWINRHGDTVRAGLGA